VVNGPPGAPVDPRLGWDLPELGHLPTLARLDALVHRVLAPNPSGMSLDGTNTYVVVDPVSRAAAIVDPGPTDAEHLARVHDVLDRTDAECRWILVTHHHVDHAEAAQPWAHALGATVAAAAPSLAGSAGRVLIDGDQVKLGTVTIETVCTPGHCADHVAFRLPNGVLLVGDHVLGRGTSVVTHPEGDLLAYVESLRRVYDLGPDALYPGHGPELTHDPAAVLDFYRAHREHRRRQVLSLVPADGITTVQAVVASVYRDVPRTLWGAAEQSTRAALVMLAAQGLVRFSAGSDDIARVRMPTDAEF